MIPSQRVGATLGVHENRHSSCRSEHVREPQAHLVSSVVFPATSTTCVIALRSQRGAVLGRRSMRVKGRDSRPLSALLSLPRRSGNRRGRADPIARQLAAKGLEGGYVLDGTRPARRLVGRGMPSPLTSRARTHAPACLTQSPRSAKGRLTEHRDPVARRTPGSEERVCRSAAAPARNVT